VSRVAYRRKSLRSNAAKSQAEAEHLRGDMDREIRSLRQETGRLKAKLSLAEKKHREATLPYDAKHPAQPAKSGVGGAAGLGVAASGTKEVLDWLWEVMRPNAPYLYDFLHLDGVDAGIMAMISAFFVWLGGRQLK
jgi:ElaB/YqjD/DUF883 family membrane-anchored ribosome-binding protein